MIPVVLVLLASVPLVLLPILTLPSPPLVWLGGATALLCVAAAVLGSIPVAAAATFVSVLAYTVALWLARAPHDLAGAVVFGIGLVIVLEGTAAARRFRGATVLPSALRRQARHWLGLAVAGLLVAGAAVAVAELAVFGGPGVLHAAVAAAGALAVVLGVVGVLRQHLREPSESRRVSAGGIDAERRA